MYFKINLIPSTKENVYLGQCSTCARCEHRACYGRWSRRPNPNTFSNPSFFTHWQKGNRRLRSHIFSRCLFNFLTFFVPRSPNDCPTTFYADLLELRKYPLLHHFLCWFVRITEIPTPLFLFFHLLLVNWLDGIIRRTKRGEFL